MSENINQEEILDESILEDSALEGENEDRTGEDGTPEENKKNSSNFKKLYKKAKEAEKRAKELEAKLKELEAAKQEQDSLSDIDKDERLELKIFWIEHPEAKGRLSEILKVSKEHNMDLDTAWSFLKATTPPESKSYNDFEVKGKKSGWTIDYKSISLEESLKLSPEERRAWRKANGWSV